MKDIGHYFTQKTVVINREIQNLLDSWNFTEPLNGAIRYILESGGKRIRPVLTLISCEAVGGSTASALPAAIAIELVHNSSLLWDDVIDADELRRGKLTVHKKWDKNVAILAGAMLTTKALELISKYQNLLGLYLNAVGEMIEGQMLDISKNVDPASQPFESKSEAEIFENLRKRFQEKMYQEMDWREDAESEKLADFVEFEEERVYFNMIAKKTSALMKLATNMGAVLGGGTQEKIDALTDYGFYVGLTFQISDDLIGILSNEQALGKPIGSDLRQGKLNLYTIFALRNLEGERLKEFFKLMHSETNSTMVQKGRQVLEDCGALRYAKDKLQLVASKARAALAPLQDSESKQVLNQLINFIIERNF
ncbi:MAG: polyprenyl synthetase family protein [Candidatus Helarchaeota archaeon]|nr:polyprenyl synthetase family protein [Candidatus Helarchaeota archaeon]